MILLKISDDFTGGETIFSAQDIVIDEDLHGVGNISFSFDTRKQEFAYFREFRKIEAFFVENGEDVSIFTGYITNIVFDFFTAKIEGKCEKHWMKNKILYSAKNFSLSSVKTSVDLVLGEANARMEPHEMQFTSDVFVSNSFTLEAEKGKNYQDFFDDVSSNAKAEWTVKYGKIIFRDTLGEVKNFTLLSLENSPSNENTIGVEYTKNAEEIATALLGNADGTYFLAETSSVFPRIEKYISMEKGETQTALDEKLEKMKDSRNILKITPTVENFSLNIGDTLNVRIERNNEIFNYSDSVRVLSRKISFLSGVPVIELGLSDASRKFSTPKYLLANFEKRISKLEK